MLAWTHHEKVDGTGYPRGVGGDGIRQVVGFADAPAGANDYRIALTYEAGQGF